MGQTRPIPLLEFLPMSIRPGNVGGVEQVILPPVGGPGKRDSIPLPARAAPVRCP
jgi:hypothetical protein